MKNLAGVFVFKLCALLLIVAATSVFAAELGVLPNAALTPGALNPDVRQSNIDKTICVSGYTKTIRPPAYITNHLKAQQIVAYGYSDTRPGDYEEDHLISLELGGAPRDPKNLWPQPHKVNGKYNSFAKDKLENRLKRMVCRGDIPLTRAQQEIATDWVAAYIKYVGN